jgi:hypothetical protein
MTPRDRASRSFFIHCVLVLAAVLFFSGCFAGIPYRLEPASVAQLDTVRARSVVVQEKISIEVAASSYGAGLGLIGALVDVGVNKGRTSDAERRVAPLRDQTQDLDFRAKFWEQLGPAIQAVEWPRVADLQTATAFDPFAAADAKEAHLLTLHTFFSLSPNSAVLRIHTEFYLYMKGSKIAKAIGSVSYWSRDIGKAAEGKYKEDEEAVALWAADNCAAYRAAVDEGIAETVKMLRMALPYAGGKDISKPGPAAQFQYDLTHGSGDFGLKSSRNTLRGAVLERTDDRLMLQVQPGPIYSIPMAEAEERKLP